MHDLIPIYFKALFVASLFYLISAIIIHFTPLLKRYHIPGSFISGILALLLGPQVLGHATGFQLYSTDILDTWDKQSLFLVNIVFASVFLGRKIPKLKTSLRLAIPQASLGQVLAWGQYFVGGIVTLLVLIPVFQLDQSAASLIEVSFQGGVGVAVGMKETFKSIGAESMGSLALAMAPIAMLIGILSGIAIINLKGDKRNISGDDQDQKINNNRSSCFSTFQKNIPVQLALIGLAIYFGFFLLEVLKFIEQSILIGHFYDQSFVKHIPLFPMALIGGAFVQVFMDKLIPKLKISNRETITKIQELSLGFLILMAIGNINLSLLKGKLIVLIILIIVGVAWNITCFLTTYKILIPDYSFERGIADYGQSMGTTSIGLMLLSIADKKNMSRGREAFGMKQLLFEPFLGGGIITAISPVLIHKIGLYYFTGFAFFMMVVFFLVGLIYSKKLN